MHLSPAIPLLRIFSEEKAREFYLDFLGFTVEWEHRFGDGMPLYAQIRRSDLVLHLTEHHGDCSPGSAMRIEIDDVDALQQELMAKQYSYARPGVADMPWGSRDMSVTDPFGNRLTFTTAVNDGA